MIKHVLLAPVFCLLAGLPASAQYSGAPYSGSPVQLPGTVYAANFDHGGEGVSYHDTDWINWGGQYRDTGVDIEFASDGGYDIGWFDAGEWMNYTVDVASAGSYSITLRVASPYGGSLYVGFNNASNVWQQVSVPNTGDWQNWTTINFTATLSAGWQQMTLMSDSGGFNVESVSVDPSGSHGPWTDSGDGTLLSVAEWNIQINDNSEWHARVAMDNLLASGPRPDVIVIVEAYSNLFNTYIDELQSQTGQTWYGAFATHCASGDWNGSGCNNSWYQGVGIFSTHWISDTSSTFFPYADCWTSARAGLRAQIDVNGLPVQVFATHLQTGGCANDAWSRSSSMQDLKGWAGNFSSPQLVAGDFNADPDQIDTTWGMAPNFVDSWWVAGGGSWSTAFAPNPTMKLDYWFSDASGRATAQATWVNTSAWWVSDHLPLQATFFVK